MPEPSSVGEREQPGFHLLARMPAAVTGTDWSWGGLHRAHPPRQSFAVGLGRGMCGHRVAPCARAMLRQHFSPRGACTWGQPAGSCRCPWPPVPGMPPAMTASSPGTPTVPGTAEPAAPPPLLPGRAGLLPPQGPPSLPPARSHAAAHRPGTVAPVPRVQQGCLWPWLCAGGLRRGGAAQALHALQRRAGAGHPERQQRMPEQLRAG